MKIALADDHALFRAGLCSALKDAFGPQTQVLEAADRDGLAATLENETCIDLVICDLRMPGMETDDSVAGLVRINTAIPLVMVSASDEPADACGAIRQGAKGYILKSDSMAVLQHALELVLAGGTYAPVEALMAGGDMAADSGTLRASPRSGPPLPALSERQKMIFERLAEGKSNKVIARELGIAEGTVKAQLRTVFRKLGVANRVQAALAAAQVLEPSAAESRPAGLQVATGHGGEEGKIYPFPGQA
ncbi:response regulator transcription factor [Pelagibius litoralis]|uniref:Response regulator transcription factor n=1 Tax=Pelagibius litoralis TaxID=374515 RepID=A0A967EV79_9PROT|nr:response regulator transcription factor [Pelagibius litoralis]NIA67444.1 response regulator transcription factor [Pelagibius litoralis]